MESGRAPQASVSLTMAGTLPLLSPCVFAFRPPPLVVIEAEDFVPKRRRLMLSSFLRQSTYKRRRCAHGVALVCRNDCERRRRTAIQSRRWRGGARERRRYPPLRSISAVREMCVVSVSRFVILNPAARSADGVRDLLVVLFDIRRFYAFVKFTSSGTPAFRR